MTLWSCCAAVELRLFTYFLIGHGSRHSCYLYTGHAPHTNEMHGPAWRACSLIATSQSHQLAHVNRKLYTRMADRIRTPVDTDGEHSMSTVYWTTAVKSKGRKICQIKCGIWIYDIFIYPFTFLHLHIPAVSIARIFQFLFFDSRKFVHHFRVELFLSCTFYCLGRLNAKRLGLRHEDSCYRRHQ